MSMVNEGTITGKLIDIAVKSETPEYIFAVVTLEVAEGNRVPLELSANPTNAAGAPSKVYNNFMKFKDSAKTAAAVGLEEADIISASLTSFKENIFSPDGTAIINSTQIKGVFFEQKPLASPTASINVEGIVVSVVDEIVKDVPTGKVIVTLENVNVFNGKPYTQEFKLKVSEPQNVAFVKTNYTAGSQVTVTVEPRVYEETVQVTLADGAGFGGAITEEKHIFIKEYEIVKGSVPVQPLLDAALLEEGRAARQGRIEKAKEKAKNQGSAKPAVKTGTPAFSL